MNRYLQIRHVVLVVLMLLTFTGWSQEYKQGIKQGLVKVKFSPTMTTSLNQMNVRTSASGLTTGLAKFDVVASSTKATNMYRIFPYDAKNEAKLVKHGLHLWYAVEIDQNTDPIAAASQFKKLAEVTTAEVEREKVLAPYEVKNYVPTAGTNSTLPFNDPLLKDQWHYDNTGQSDYGDADVNLFSAWTTTTGASNIVVSVHDEGIDVNHADLKPNVWVNQAEANGQPNVDDDGNGFIDDVNGYNFAKNKGAVDPQYHGTHVAGTIAAVNNNGIGVSGVAGGNGTGNGVKVMSLQIIGAGSIERSYVYAANNGALISQNSWGYVSNYYVEQVVLDAIDYFIEEAGDFAGSPMKGGIVIFAAGNSNYDSEWYPGYYSNTMAVGALGPEWIKAEYSNYGEWVDVSAPGGDIFGYGSKSGVLSTIPGDKYAYLEGTSMACPHVSGIAALALANRTQQLTSDELWNKLVTGVVNIDGYNEDYIGKLGSGAIDANLAIKNDQSIAPIAISDLAITGIAQEFATLSWTVPTDTDDNQPLTFELYFHTQPITAGNLVSADNISLINNQLAGSTFNYELENLLGLTTYYFALTSTDRWGNTSVLSNVAMATTNEGPSIAVDVNSQEIYLDIDASVSTSATHDITILNEAAGILRWNHLMRHRNTSLAYSASAINYPTTTSRKRASDGIVSMRAVNDGKELRNNDPQTMAYTAIEKSYAWYATNIIGETNISLPNSAAAKFDVTEPDGFNLTQARMYLKHDPSLGPVIMEIYEGTSPTKNNLIYAQEHSNWSTDESWAYITLNEQIYFESGSTFWIVFHVPSGNLFPLGIGFEIEPNYSQNCLMSFDLGGSWTPLEDALNSKDFAWAISADSYNQHLGTYLSLSPSSGDINGNEEAATTLMADASTLINGSYSANVILTSNDATNQEYRIPVSLNVSGHQPNLKHIDIADFGAVFQGTSKTLELVIENAGYGNFNDPIFSIDNSEFVLDGYAPWQIQAREEVVVSITFAPTGTGNTNGTLSITNGNQTYEIALFGVSSETSKIAVNPASQTINDITLGDVVEAQVTVTNDGAFPLKYFVPGFDTKGISDNWPSDYHSYGYVYRRSDDSNPISYDFQDISATGKDVTSVVNAFGKYAEVDMGFDFPYYGEAMTTLYVAKQGFTTFDNTVQPLNQPVLGNSYSPRGYISPLGTFVDLSTQGQIFYQVEADHVIVQWDNVTDGYSGSLTAQMVLYTNGDIRFFYDNMGYESWAQSYLNILIEDLNWSDGILIQNYEKTVELYSGLALGFDYPGPNIISSITNGSGLLAPGASAVMDVTMETNTLVEGTTNRYLNIISNDPANAESRALIQLEITSGGVATPIVSIDEAAFGDVFQGAVRSIPFTIKNQGTALVNITDMTFTNGDFVLTGEQSVSITPGLYKGYSIEIPTGTLATLEDWLTINYLDGSSDVIHITGNVVDPPGINVDISTITETLAYGETSTHPFAIENTGLAPLEVSATGKHWLTFNTTESPARTTYAYDKHNEGGVYQWIDIRETGTKMPIAEDIFSEEDFWRDLTLPFPIRIYGQEYTDIKVGDNGIVSLDENPPVTFFTDNIPSTEYPGTFIMPYFTFGLLDTYFYPEDETGLYYQFYDDKVIITWSYLVNNFGGMGDPVSAQMILYPNGTMKFQYRVEEGGADLTSNNTVIGIQENSENGVSISAYNAIDHGSGLAYILMPVETYEVAPGETLSGDIEVDARNIYGGVYNESLKIVSNVPGSELLLKPVELTVTGDAVLDVPAEIAFGSIMIAFEFGSPLNSYIDMNLSNTGSAPLEITWASMADATQGLSLQIYTLVDGWFGPELRWADISELYSPWAWETPVFTINPGEYLKARAAFGPSVSGDFTDEMVLTTSLGEISVTMTGTGFEPPVMEVDDTPIVVNMNMSNESATPAIAFNNTNGASDLNYEITIDFGRADAVVESSMQFFEQSSFELQSVPSTVSAARVSATNTIYNRVISHTESTEPDTYVGTGGSAPFTVATKYNAGSSGFNLSHVQTWFTPESLTEGTISVEVRAGGSSLSEAVLLGAGEVQFGAGTGDWLEIALDEAVGIYPNENFYVIATYPLGIQFPQGTLSNVEMTPNRYFYYNEGVWEDIQTVNGFSTSGWLMFAAEETAGNTSWLSVTSSLSGTIAAGESSTIELLLEGAFAQRGDQIANVIISSNDPNNSSVSVPVTLHLNDGPIFNGPEEVIVMSEGETRVISASVIDMEDNSFTLDAAEVYAGVSFTFDNGDLEVTLTPTFGDAGMHTYSFIATDEYGASNQMDLEVEVLRTNQAPVYVGPAEGLVFGSLDDISEHAISDYFMDPDGDSFSFEVISSDLNTAEVYKSSNKFLVKTVNAGTTAFEFRLKDTNGAEVVIMVDVEVNLVASIDDNLNYNVNLYPNPTSSILNIKVEGEIAGAYRVRILNLSGVTIQEINDIPSQHRNFSLSLDQLSVGIYLVEVSDESGTSVHRILKN